MNREKGFYEAIADRRTVYGLGKNIKISNEEIEEIVKYAVKNVPSSFNSQTARVVVLLNDKHDKFWSITEDILRKEVGDEEKFKSTKEKMDAFSAAYGTLLFFEDMNIVKDLQNQFPLYADNFAIWYHHSSGMLQHTLWMAFRAEDMGASLQHYNPLVDDQVKAEFQLPDHWKLIAQMPFGSIEAQPGEKEFAPIENRVKVLK